ncbi:hypothetical protein CTAYLR_002529 [Chrysophaeum taylorii]|uniref:Uncharacterized protein n=1 Tax=Chrysophaeum taylorii TaxID=2483200 RepID=A0AAD7UFT5_9STRA|nr:hypothetical protein CTAYLR_002529 [Chrysophaeum taylorii]
MALLAELESLLESCGGFEAIDEFGVVVEAERCWNYDAASRGLSLDKSHVIGVWREARSQSTPTATAAVVLLSGDVYTAWNARKRHLKNARAELALNAVALRRHAKAASAWAHRRWCLERFERDAIDEDLDLCTGLAERYPRNYAAWTHRLWVVERRPHRIPSELDFVKAWLGAHVTDYSAANYALQLAVKTATPAQALADLQILVGNLAETFPHLARTQSLLYLARAISRAGEIGP